MKRFVIHHDAVLSTFFAVDFALKLYAYSLGVFNPKFLFFLSQHGEPSFEGSLNYPTKQYS